MKSSLQVFRTKIPHPENVPIEIPRRTYVGVSFHGIPAQWPSATHSTTIATELRIRISTASALCVAPALQCAIPAGIATVVRPTVMKLKSSHHIGLILKFLFCLLLEFPNHKGQNITAENRQEDTGGYPQYQAADDGWLCGKFHTPITHPVATVCKRITLISFPDKPRKIIDFRNLSSLGLPNVGAHQFSNLVIDRLSLGCGKFLKLGELGQSQIRVNGLPAHKRLNNQHRRSGNCSARGQPSIHGSF